MFKRAKAVLSVFSQIIQAIPNCIVKGWAGLGWLLLGLGLGMAGCAPSPGGEAKFIPLPTTNTDFREPVFLSTLNFPQSLKAADLNADGRSDLVVLSQLDANNAFSATLQVFLGTATGYPSTPNHTTRLEANAAHFLLMSLDGNGTDNDAIIPILDNANPRLWVCLNVEVGCTAPIELELLGIPADIKPLTLGSTKGVVASIGSVTRSGADVDLRLQVFLFTSSGLSTTPANSATLGAGGHIAVGDVDGDSIDDVLISHIDSGTIALMQGSATGAYTNFLTSTSSNFILGTTNAARDIFLDDFDGDGDLDIAAIDGPSVLVWLRGTSATEYLAYSHPFDNPLEYLRRGPGQELIGLHGLQGAIERIRIDGTGAFTVTRHSTNRRVTDLAIGDFNGGGDDLVLLEQDERSVGVLHASGYTHSQIGLSATMRSVVTGDFDNGNGGDDVALLEPNNDRVVLLLSR